MTQTQRRRLKAQRNQALGLCRQCTEKPIENYFLCANHLEKHRTRIKQRSKSKQKEHNKTRRHKMIDWYNHQKSTHSCKDCGTTNPNYLEFSYRDIKSRDPKIKCMYEAVMRSWSATRILEEIAKCDVYCGNCRKKRTNEYTKIINLAKSIGCVHCQEKEICCIELHHIDSKTKSFTIGGSTPTYYTLEELSLEIAKCIPLCINCHRQEEIRIKQEARCAKKSEEYISQESEQIGYSIVYCRYLTP